MVPLFFSFPATKLMEFLYFTRGKDFFVIIFIGTTVRLGEQLNNLLGIKCSSSAQSYFTKIFKASVTLTAIFNKDAIIMMIAVTRNMQVVVQ